MSGAQDERAEDGRKVGIGMDVAPGCFFFLLSFFIPVSVYTDSEWMVDVADGHFEVFMLMDQLIEVASFSRRPPLTYPRL